MSYQAIALRWRPNRFEDLVGQEHVAQTLTNAIRLGRVAPAYLFSGPRGVGKTSVARIFAKALRCPQAREALPCNECPECLAISSSRSVDVAEIDGASNNGVESVRGIRDNVAYSASQGFYKIYIIDEVHMLSVAAFNALLKTLEEPPKHVVFVLATTEAQKIPLTVLSRCQRFEFRRLMQAQIVQRLRAVLEKETHRVSEEGLSVIASHSDGSLRDALSLLDTVLSFASEVKGPLSEKEVSQALGVSDTTAVGVFLTRILSRDTMGIFRCLEEAYAAGIDLKYFAERCLEELRLLYLLQAAKESGHRLGPEALDVSASRFVQLEAMVQGADLLSLERMAQILSKAIFQMGWSRLPRFVLEMAAVRMAGLDGLSQIEKTLMGVVTSGAAPEKKIATPPAPTPAPPPAPQSAPVELDWKGFVEAVTRKRPPLGALLGHAGFRLEGKQVQLSFPAKSFYEREVSDPKTRREIEELLKAFFGAETQLVLMTGETLNASLEEARAQQTEALRQQALSHPVVQQFQQILGAEVVEVRVEHG